MKPAGRGVGIWWISTAQGVREIDRGSEELLRGGERGSGRGGREGEERVCVIVRLFLPFRHVQRL